jgi:phage recombination protein Bet
MDQEEGMTVTTEPGNAIALQDRRALAVTEDQIQWSPQQLAALTQIGVENASDADLMVFLDYAKRTKLDPFQRQIYMIERSVPGRGKRQTIQMGIDGFRIVAHRTGKYGGRVKMEWADGQGRWFEMWPFDFPPVAARVYVRRLGWPDLIVGVAMYREFVATKFDGDPTHMWRKMPANQLAKCFTPDTEVLTDRGFRTFGSVGSARIMQVTDAGIEPCDARPFVQEYNGPMISVRSNALDFVVTPNHDMLTTNGLRIAAGDLYDQAAHSGGHRLPLAVTGSRADDPAVSDDDLRLVGYTIADGSFSYRQVRFSVSRDRKVARLREMDPIGESVRHCAGDVGNPHGRIVHTRSDKTLFTFDRERVARFVRDGKTIVVDQFYALSSRQVRIVVDAWQEFDGHSATRGGARRIYTSREDHVSAFEVLAIMAGYSISIPRKRENDLSDRTNYYVTLSSKTDAPIVRYSDRGRTRPHIAIERDNPSGEVWCVTVPSGQIVVRRRGLSMVIFNCAEAAALRVAFPHDLSGIYVEEEMEQADNPEPGPNITVPGDAAPSNGPDWNAMIDERLAHVNDDPDMVVGELQKLLTQARGMTKDPAVLNAILEAQRKAKGIRDSREAPAEPSGDKPTSTRPAQDSAAPASGATGKGGTTGQPATSPQKAKIMRLVRTGGVTDAAAQHYVISSLATAAGMVVTWPLVTTSTLTQGQAAAVLELLEEAERDGTIDVLVDRHSPGDEHKAALDEWTTARAKYDAEQKEAKARK